MKDKICWGKGWIQVYKIYYYHYIGDLVRTTTNLDKSRPEHNNCNNNSGEGGVDWTFLRRLNVTSHPPADWPEIHGYKSRSIEVSFTCIQVQIFILCTMIVTTVLVSWA